MNKRKKNIILVVIILFILGIVYIHLTIYATPKTRLQLKEDYSEMKESRFRYYINLPIDYQNPKAGKYKGFYLLSPHFFENKNITFFLTDGQMELVNTNTNFSFFEEILGGSSYVLMSVRGQSPTFFPEIYKNGNTDLLMAMKLLNSDQQVEDIEQIRLEMIRKKLLTKEDKINIFGASGAGILAQQYVSKYGKNVNRAILESTGAPDISQKMHIQYSPNFKEFNPQANILLETILEKRKLNLASLSNILYQIGRNKTNPKTEQLKILQDLQNNGCFLSYQFKPMMNLSFLNYLIKSPKEIAPRVRWFELVGYDLLRYNPKKGINLLYEISDKTLSDFVNHCKLNQYQPKKFSIKRNFDGEVLIIKGTEDVVFGDSINKEIQKSYPNAKLIFFKDGHRMQENKNLYKKARLDFLQNGFKNVK
ncbi:hypothetical protein [Cloacibacterium sp.]|uniref:hypothetical protein n=1 Tax=Cloacibacterium sp. TaxID=1913682 RepID=UPI0039E3C3D0